MSKQSIDKRDKLGLIASKDEAEGSLSIHQDARANEWKWRWAMAQRLKERGKR